MSDYKGYSRIFSRLSFTALVLLAFLAGCGGGGGDGGSGSGGSSGPPDLTAPTVTAMSPGEDNFGIATNSKLTATFSEAMVPAAINTANFRLALGDDISLPGTVSYDAANRIAVFTPAGGLLPGTRYTATVITGITDPAGNPLMSDFAWCFTTGADADFIDPSVASTIPANAASGVPVNRKVSATFSEEMNSLTLTPANFRVTGPAGAVSGKVTYLGGTAVFAPTNGLASNTTYTTTITAGARDLAGNAAQPMAWSFATGASADATPPGVISTDPAGSNVAIGSTINVSFNEPMNPATITTATFRVTAPGPNSPTDPVAGTVSVTFDAASNTATATFTRINHLITPTQAEGHLTPVSNLEPGTTYTATLTTAARDMAGNAVASKVWSFTTAP